METLEKHQKEEEIILNFFKKYLKNEKTFKNGCAIIEIWNNSELLDFLNTCPWFQNLKDKEKSIFFTAIGERANILASFKNYQEQLKQGYILIGTFIYTSNEGFGKLVEMFTDVKDDIDHPFLKAGFVSFEKLFKEIKSLKIYDKDSSVYKLFLKHKNNIMPKLEEIFSKGKEIIETSKEELKKL